MDWLLESIAAMHGPQFLAVYGLVAVATILVCAWLVRASDSTKSLPPLPVPAEPSPYEIAYLRGGDNELLRLILFRLVQQGAVRMLIEEGTAAQKDTFMLEDSSKPQDSVHQEVARRMNGRTSKEVFHDPWVKREAAEHSGTYRSQLEGERLLLTPEEQYRHARLAWIGALVIAGLGFYKLVSALMEGHTNVMFLIVIIVFGVGILWNSCTIRLTHRGKKYLRSLESAFGRWKEQKAEIGESQLLLLVSIFGVAVLAGTTYDYFQKSFSQSNGSCGSCGGGCDGCGGCGGCGD